MPISRWERSVGVEVLQGEILEAVEVNEDRDEIVFRTADGESFLMYHDQDCCERVRLEDVCGDLDDLIGTVLVSVEESTNREDDPPEYAESFTWTFYKFRTNKGDVTLRWLGESNGYYSESVSLCRL